MTDSAEAQRAPQAPETRRWHERYERFAGRYDELGLCPELLAALAKGLKEWAVMLPQVETDRNGRHKLANSWGLGPELNKLSLIDIQLRLGGHERLAERLHLLVTDLHKAGRLIDDCYPKVSDDEEAAEQRLVIIARSKANDLAAVLSKLMRPLFGNVKAGAACCAAESRDATSPKRAIRLANIELLRNELILFIKAAQSHQRAAADMNVVAAPMKRPSQRAFGKRLGLGGYTVSRCIGDPAATELNLLWRVADDPDAIMRYVPR